MYNKKISSKVEGAVPCGNPKRYSSRDVVHMPPFGSSGRKRSSNESDVVATEGERHLKSLVSQQIKTDVTLAEQFSQHRSFSSATSHDPGVEKLIGVHNYGHFQSVNDLDSRIDYLRHCGLDDGEITLRLKEELKDEVPITSTGYGTDPQNKLQILREIDRKIKEKEESLQVPDSFKGALELSRQALELEKSQSLRQGKESTLTDIITTQKKFEVTHPDDPVNHIHEMLSGIEGEKRREPRRERRKRRKLERKQLYYAKFNHDIVADTGSEFTDDGSTNDQESCDQNHRCLTLTNNLDSSEHSQKLVSKPRTEDITEKSDILLNSESKTCVSSETSKSVKTICTQVQFVSADEIARCRLGLEEIRAIDKFQNYTEGEPNNVVYVKNLPAKTTEEDLVALFGSFQSEGKPKIVFKLLSGRMKGQAFITFPDELTATKAVKLVNGYLLNGRPVILSFGKQRN